MALAACEANSTRISSSSSLNTFPPSIHQVEVADVHTLVAHRRALEGPGRQQVGGEAVRAHECMHVRQPQHARQVAEMLKQPRPVRPLHQPAVFLSADTGGNEVLELPGIVEGSDGAVARAGQRPRTVHDLVQHRIEIETGADAQACRTQDGYASL